MRGFNEKLFGDKLVAGQLPTQLGLIGSQEVTDFDADAIAFFARVTTAGGTLSATEQLAVDTLVKQMKLDGIWSLMKAIYPMVGASAAACAQNLKSSSFTGTFTSGWTFASTGATPNGTSAYMDSNLNANNNLGVNNLSISFYTSTNGAASNSIIYGVSANRTTYLPIIQCYPRINTTSLFLSDLTDFNSRVSFLNNTTAGFYVNTRTANNSSKTFKNNSLAGSTTVLQTQTTLPNYTIPFAAFFDTISYSNFANYLMSFASIGDGLTDTQAGNFYTAVQAFQTTLSRNV
jgi:hypothetical protein